MYTDGWDGGNSIGIGMGMAWASLGIGNWELGTGNRNWEMWNGKVDVLYCIECACVSIGSCFCRFDLLIVFCAVYEGGGRGI